MKHISKEEAQKHKVVPGPKYSNDLLGDPNTSYPIRYIMNDNNVVEAFTIGYPPEGPEWLPYMPEWADKITQQTRLNNYVNRAYFITVIIHPFGKVEGRLYCKNQVYQILYPYVDIRFTLDDITSVENNIIHIIHIGGKRD